MSNSLHVYHLKSRGWVVRRPGALRVIAYYPTRREALVRARSYLIKRGGGNILIHRADGRIGERREIDASLTEENNHE